MAASTKITERGVDGVAVEALIPASQPGDVFPAGTVVDYAGSAAPSGWLICDGSTVSRTTYPQLFANIGTTYGAGDGSTTFGIPDCRGRKTIGKHSSGTFVTLGGVGGEENHTLSAAEMPSHTHTGPSHTHSLSVSGTTASAGSHTHTITDTLVSDSTTSLIHAVQTGSAGTYGIPITPGVAAAGAHTHTVTSTGTSGAAGTGATGSAGSSATHNNMDPYIVLNKIIRAY